MANECGTRLSRGHWLDEDFGGEVWDDERKSEQARIIQIAKATTGLGGLLRLLANNAVELRDVTDGDNDAEHLGAALEEQLFTAAEVLADVAADAAAELLEGRKRDMGTRAAAAAGQAKGNGAIPVRCTKGPGAGVTYQRQDGNPLRLNGAEWSAVVVDAGEYQRQPGAWGVWCHGEACFLSQHDISAPFRFSGPVVGYLGMTEAEAGQQAEAAA